MRSDWSVHLHSAVTSLCHVRALSSNVRVPGGHELQSPEHLLKTFFPRAFLCYITIAGLNQISIRVLQKSVPI